MISPFLVFPACAAAMVAFAANSLFCRAALLGDSGMDPVMFTVIRLASGALVLAALCRNAPKQKRPGKHRIVSALMLFIYALGFSLAYRDLDTGTGALILFGAVQVTMLGAAFLTERRPKPMEMAGMATAFGGLMLLFLPGATAPSLAGGFFMACAGAAWGIYSISGKSESHPLVATAQNFKWALVPALAIHLLRAFEPGTAAWAASAHSILWAVASGALASGLGYALWYRVLPVLSATRAGTIQLSVPILACAGGILILNEPLTWELVLSALLVLSGIGLCLAAKHR